MNYSKKRINKDFFKRWTPEMAYVLGWIYTDGNLSSSTSKFKITTMDRQVLDRILLLFGTNYILEECKTKEGKDYFILRISNREMYGDLLRLGLTPKKTRSIIVPNIPDYCFSHFLRGVIDGDGSIYVEKTGILRTSIVCGSYDFLDGIQRTISRLYGLKSKELSRNRSAFQLKYSMKESLILLERVYRGAGRNMLQRKYDKYMGTIDSLNQTIKWRHKHENS